MVDSSSFLILGLVVLFSLGISILCIWTSYQTAKKKNRNTIAWAVATFFFGLIPLIIILILSPLPIKNDFEQK